MVKLNRIKRRKEGNNYVRVTTVLLVPMLLITIASVGYAALILTDKVFVGANLSNANYCIEITDCTEEYYNGYAGSSRLYRDNRKVIFNDGSIFPGWELVLVTKIHNKIDSWLANFTYIISYSEDEGVTWIKCNETELYNLFGINYTDGFYLGPGPDGIWDTPEHPSNDDVPLPETYYMYPCNSTYKKEHLIFDPNDPNLLEQLEDKWIMIKITIVATYPDDPFKNTSISNGG